MEMEPSGLGWTREAGEMGIWLNKTITSFPLLMRVSEVKNTEGRNYSCYYTIIS